MGFHEVNGNYIAFREVLDCTSLHDFRETDANGDVGAITANGGILASDTTPIMRGASGLISQELHFIPSVRDICAQWRANRHRCIPRNSDLAIAADGSYQYCFDDIRHSHPIGYVGEMSVREALSARERTGPDPRLCDDCGVRRRYGLLEIGRVAFAYMRA